MDSIRRIISFFSIVFLCSIMNMFGMDQALKSVLFRSNADPVTGEPYDVTVPGNEAMCVESIQTFIEQCGGVVDTNGPFVCHTYNAPKVTRQFVGLLSYVAQKDQEENVGKYIDCIAADSDGIHNFANLVCYSLVVNESTNAVYAALMPHVYKQAFHNTPNTPDVGLNADFSRLAVKELDIVTKHKLVERVLRGYLARAVRKGLDSPTITIPLANQKNQGQRVLSHADSSTVLITNAHESESVMRYTNSSIISKIEFYDDNNSKVVDTQLVVRAIDQNGKVLDPKVFSLPERVQELRLCNVSSDGSLLVVAKYVIDYDNHFVSRMWVVNEGIFQEIPTRYGTECYFKTNTQLYMLDKQTASLRLLDLESNRVSPVCEWDNFKESDDYTPIRNFRSMVFDKKAELFASCFGGWESIFVVGKQQDGVFSFKLVDIKELLKTYWLMPYNKTFSNIQSLNFISEAGHLLLSVCFATDEDPISYDYCYNVYTGQCSGQYSFNKYCSFGCLPTLTTQVLSIKNTVFCRFMDSKTMKAWSITETINPADNYILNPAAAYDYILNPADYDWITGMHLMDARFIESPKADFLMMIAPNKSAMALSPLIDSAARNVLAYLNEGLTLQEAADLDATLDEFGNIKVSNAGEKQAALQKFPLLIQAVLADNNIVNVSSI